MVVVSVGAVLVDAVDVAVPERADVVFGAFLDEPAFPAVCDRFEPAPPLDEVVAVVELEAGEVAGAAESEADEAAA